MTDSEDQLRAFGALYRKREHLVVAAYREGVSVARIVALSGLGRRTVHRMIDRHREIEPVHEPIIDVIEAIKALLENLGYKMPKCGE